MVCVGGFSSYPRGTVHTKDTSTHLNNEPLEQIPHRVQMVMAGETTPILSGAIPAFKMFISRWEQISELHPKLSMSAYARPHTTTNPWIELRLILWLWVSVIMVNTLFS